MCDCARTSYERTLLAVAALIAGLPGIARALDISQFETAPLIVEQQPSQIGLVARRKIKDSEGRLMGEILYRGGGRMAYGGLVEADKLVRAMVKLYRLDGQGRRVREEQYTGDMRLDRMLVTEYGPDGRQSKLVWLDAEGTRTYEIRYADGRSQSHLYFDNTGERLVGVRGRMPSDLDLPYGWGPESDGLICGIAPSSLKSPLDDMHMSVTVRNLGKSDAYLLGHWWYAEVEIELRDAEGRLVSQDTEYMEKRAGELARMNPGQTESRRWVRPGEAWLDGYLLCEWYLKLPPGKYSLELWRRLSNGDKPLKSNAIGFEITESRRPKRGWTRSPKAFGDRWNVPLVSPWSAFTTRK